jgi:cbb3-type cytochrome oxidase subunit 3
MLLPAVAVLAFVGIVAIAATGSTTTGTADTRPPGDWLIDSIISLGMLGVVVGGVMFLYGLTQRKAVAREAAKMRRRGYAFSLFTTMLALLVIGAYFKFRDWEEREPVVEVAEPAFPGAPESPVPPTGAPDPTPYEPRFAWIPVVVVVGLGLLAVAAYVLSTRRKLVAEEADLAEQIAIVLDDTLDDLRAEQDPRRAVIAAYARLERVLTAHGLPRGESETAVEYLGRILGSLSVDERAARRLTALFAEAKFSLHMIDATMKEEAIDALASVRDDLRRAAATAAEPALPPPAGQPA